MSIKFSPRALSEQRECPLRSGGHLMCRYFSTVSNYMRNFFIKKIAIKKATFRPKRWLLRYRS